MRLAEREGFERRSPQDLHLFSCEGTSQMASAGLPGATKGNSDQSLFVTVTWLR